MRGETTHRDSLEEKMGRDSLGGKTGLGSLGGKKADSQSEVLGEPLEQAKRGKMQVEGPRVRRDKRATTRECLVPTKKCHWPRTSYG
jgi:hypothetical protein